MADPIIPVNGGTPDGLRKILGAVSMKLGSSQTANTFSGLGGILDFLYPDGVNKNFDIRLRCLASEILWLQGGSLGGMGLKFSERTDPAAPDANQVIVYARDNGAGKTQLCARFNTGAVQVIVTEP